MTLKEKNFMAEKIERINALSDFFIQGEKNKNATIYFSLDSNLKIQQIATWPEEFNKLVEHLNSFLSNGSCSKHGLVNINKNYSIIRTEPLKWWTLGESDKIISSLNKLNVVTLDLSHSWVKLNITGPNSEKLLLHHVPLDLRNKNFPSLTFASSVIHNVGVKLLKNQKGYSLFLPRSFAVSLWNLIEQTALRYEYKIFNI
tara:strand:- start:364 stop:966 length:603 start_codon:yes stop_codon:yes gene_type:complete